MIFVVDFWMMLRKWVADLFNHLCIFEYNLNKVKETSFQKHLF